MKQTNYIISIATAFLLLAFSASSVYATTSAPDLNVSLLYYEPVPATPGSLLDVFLQVTNVGGASKKVSVTFIDNGPFSVDDEANRIKSTDSIPSQESFLVKYQVRVSQDAVPGTNYIKIQYVTDGSSNPRTMLLPIDVRSTSASVSIESVDLTPSTFEPGSVGKVTVVIRNTAGLKIASGAVKLDISDIDMAPIGGTNQQRFTDMQADDVREFEFRLAPSPSIVSGVYKVPIMITFKDQQGTEYTLSDYTGIPVGVEPELSVYFDSTDVPSDTLSGEAVVKFVNKGLSEIQFLEFQVLQNDNVKVLSESDIVYVGNIDQDDYETAELTLKVGKTAVDVPLRVTYRDSLNRQYDQTFTLKLNAKETKNATDMSWSTWLLLLVVLIPLGWWAIRRWNTKRK